VAIYLKRGQARSSERGCLASVLPQKNATWRVAPSVRSNLVFGSDRVAIAFVSRRQRFDCREWQSIPPFGSRPRHPPPATPCSAIRIGTARLVEDGLSPSPPARALGRTGRGPELRLGPGMPPLLTHRLESTDELRNDASRQQHTNCHGYSVHKFWNDDAFSCLETTPTRLGNVRRVRPRH